VTRLSRLALILLPVLTAPVPADSAPVCVGSKSDTETTILAEIAGQHLRRSGVPVEFKLRLGGTRFVWDALLAHSLDVYPEYTGTLFEQIFFGRGIHDEASLRGELARQGIGMTRPLGFANNYALGMRRRRAEEQGIRSLSDLRGHPQLRFGFSNEFIKRADGWPGLRERYRLPQTDMRGMDHRLAYEAIAAGSIDVTELYTTDAEIRRFDLVILEDDLHFFPLYEAVLVYRLDLEQRAPEAVTLLRQLEGKLSETEVIAMNDRAQQRVPIPEIAATFLAQYFGEASAVEVESAAQRLWRLTREHLTLVGVSLAAAIVVGLPLGILAAARPRAGQVILGLASVIQTIPSLALLVFMIPLLQTGTAPAIVALFLYSLLPIISGTTVGLRSIPLSVHESAEGLGLTPWSQLWLIELPLASPSILAGIRTSAVINVGTATLGALIGAGGYGQPIQTGLQMNDPHEILFGAIPAAVLALLVQGLFTLAERFLVPRGLRLPPTA
jgi:osmoprotectant transport system permease protein